ncbi:MAG: hypothetical protein PHS21_09760 [Atribacterota bacterium]|nr:hypothetical protein [Atribacterota bacterium]
MFHIPLDRILTENGKEYTTHWKNRKHGMRHSWLPMTSDIPRSSPGVPRAKGW